MTHLVESQDSALALLADPATHGGDEVRRVDTAAAIVFLAGPRALKVKRAVRFPFLDYSTLARRKAACEAEIEVNRPFAPTLYRRIVAVTRDREGRLALDGAGEPIEWAVEMRRFDETRTLDRIAERGGIADDVADELGRAVAAAHARAPVVDAAAWIVALERFIGQNAAAFAETPDLFPPADADGLVCESRAAFARVRPLLEQRGGGGLVRRGHGDLHLGNIAMIDTKPVPFDAIEFDPLIAAGDVLYDLAFLLMDLVERGLGEAANLVLNRYLVESRRPDDLDALAALPLFLSLRAAIRAKVTAASREFAGATERDRIDRTARTYFRLALALIAPAPPRLVAVGGLSGTGKSALARRLAPHLPPAPGAVVVRSDLERKAMFSVRETDRLPDEAYRADVTARVYATLAEKARRALAAGHSVVVDAVFARAQERRAIADVARACGTRFHGLFLFADLPTRLGRIGGRRADASDADGGVARRQEAYDVGPLDWTRVDAGAPLDDVLARVCDLLGIDARASHARGSAAHGKTAGCTPSRPRP